MPDDALEKFVEARVELVVRSLEEYLHGIAFQVVDTRSSVQDASASEIVTTGATVPARTTTGELGAD